ncbi:GPR1/FUN34/yaaH family-domain-containing protein [Gongronella butleri]|nr:GPR1/FUN34/yaaH family-domain-containing protein [Gongronella butleri]
MSTSTKAEYEHCEAVNVTSNHVHDPEAQVPANAAPAYPPSLKIGNARPGNPAPLGFFSFGTGSLAVGLFCLDVTPLPHAVTGVCVGYAGLGQFLCGLFELLIGNTYAATTMISFSGFFFSFAYTFSPQSGFLELAEKMDPKVLNNSTAVFMLGYSAIAFIFLLGTFRQPWLIRITLTFVFLGFFTSMLGHFLNIQALLTASGAFSICIAAVAYYIGAALLYDESNTFIKLPFF